MQKLLAAAGALVLIITACSSAETGKVKLTNAQGEQVGSATLKESGESVKIALRVSNLPPGTHGFHIHTVGKCDAPGFTSAGGHFNPYGKKHGLKSPNGPHAGDLPNLVVGADGTAKVEVVAGLATLKAGANSLFDADGSAIVIHADPDDETTDPTGNAGARLACGVITE